MTNITAPKALSNYILNQTKLKSNKNLSSLLLQGILAGLFVAIGAIGSLKVSGSIATPGLGDFLGAVVFPVGIITIIVLQAELFTSNCMIMTSVYAGQSTMKKIIKILGVVIFGNLIGAVFAALMTVASGMFSDSVINLVTDKALHKVSMPAGQLLASAIFCNIIVCMGVCLAYVSKNEMAKIITLWLAITVFVISGTEHVVANMYYLFTALFYGAALTAKGIVYNLVIAGVGNFIGGGIIVAGINSFLADNNTDKKDSSPNLAI